MSCLQPWLMSRERTYQPSSCDGVRIHAQIHLDPRVHIAAYVIYGGRGNFPSVAVHVEHLNGTAGTVLYFQEPETIGRLIDELGRAEAAYEAALLDLEQRERTWSPAESGGGSA